MRKTTEYMFSSGREIESVLTFELAPELPSPKRYRERERRREEAF